MDSVFELDFTSHVILQESQCLFCRDCDMSSLLYKVGEF